MGQRHGRVNFFSCHDATRGCGRGAGSQDKGDGAAEVRPL